MLGVSVRRPAEGKSSSRTSATLRRRLVVGGLVLLSLVLVTLSFRELGRRPGGERAGARGVRAAPVPGGGRPDRRAVPRRVRAGSTASSTPARRPSELRQENEILRQQVAQIRLAARENVRLRELLAYLDGPRFPEGYRGLATAVIARPAGTYAQSIVIAVGRNDGLAVDDPVVTQDGLVGHGEPRRLADRARDAPDRRPERRLGDDPGDGRGRRRAHGRTGRGRRSGSTASARRPSSASATRSSPRAGGRSASPRSTRRASSSGASRASGGRTPTCTRRCR